MGNLLKYKLGDRAILIKNASEEVVNSYAELSGDKNPIHIDDEYAKKSRFGARIAHGLFCQAMVSNLIGTQLPGNGAILTDERIEFKKPVYIGDDIKCICEIVKIDYDKNRCVVAFDCINQHEESVFAGEAGVYML